MIIGIDLGTTNSVMAFLNEGQETETISNKKGNEKTPSVVLLEDSDDGINAVVGETAENKQKLYPDRTLHRTKQDIDKDDLPTYEIEGKEDNPTPINAAAYILRHLKNGAETKIDPNLLARKDDVGDGDEADDSGVTEGAVITVPYDFTNKGRKHTIQAGQAAGLDVKEVINEPTAACLSYIHQNDIEGTLLVYDLGGGTFDATLVDASGIVIDVISTEGDGELGGEDFDDALFELAREKIQEQGLSDPADADPQIKAGLRHDLKDIKHNLSDVQEENYVYQSGGDMTEITITRDEFVEAIRDDIDRTFSKMEGLFEKEPVKEEGIDRDTVDHVILVGGSTKIPYVQERVEEFFDQEPLMNADPDTVVARGAAIQAADYREDVENPVRASIRNVLSHNVGVELDDGTFDEILEEDVTVPTEQTETGYTNPRANVTEIHVPVWEKGADEEVIEATEDAENLGDLTISDLPDGTEEGELDIEVTFIANHDGTLEVEAVEKVTDQTVRTEIDVGLEPDEVDRVGDDVDEEMGSSGVARADDD